MTAPELLIALPRVEPIVLRGREAGWSLRKPLDSYCVSLSLCSLDKEVQLELRRFTRSQFCPGRSEMKLSTSTPSLLLTVFVLSALLVGCGARQQVSSHVSDADYSRYVQRYPKMGDSVKRGFLSKDAAYSLRNIAPQRQIMDQFVAKVEAKRTEINARHIPEAEKRRLIREYMRQNQMRYINAANAAGKQAEQEEKVLGHSPFAR